ncbi:MAG TPA: VWA domain-containing protein [Pyrinomonadaceae bacterium]|jgi:VWFA-related protein
MKHLRRQQIFHLFALIAIFSFTVFAQNPTPTPKVEDDNEPIKVSSRLVVVPVSVTDTSGQPILGLTAKDFFVSEENKAQQIEKVSDADKVPLEIAILFDVSASTDAMFQFEQDTAAKFLQDVMRPEDHATIFTIGEGPVLLQPRADATKSAISIKSIQPTKQQTAFYDSVTTAANYLQKNAPQGTRKVLVVISDGDDTNSAGIVKAIIEAENKIVQDKLGYDDRRNFRAKTREAAKTKEQNKVLKALQNADAVFYSVNPGGNSYQLNVSSAFGQSNLERFAVETGGTAFLPKFQPISLKDDLQNSYNIKKNQETLTAIFRQLANELRAQYLVQYYSEADFALNRYVKVKVGLNNPQSYKVRAREGYFVKGPDSN